MRISFYRKNYLFVLLALAVAYLLEAAFELRNSCTGYCVHVAAVAALQEVVGNSRDHGSVVAAKLEWRENAVEIGALG